MKQRVKFIMDGGEVTRYHTVRNIQNETVGHHSFGVAMYCYLMTRPSTNLLMAALTHDLAEHQTGDIPSPSKKAYGIGEQVNALEEKLLRSVGLEFELTIDERRTLKLADIFQGMSFCLRELQLGNRNIETIYKRYASYAEDFVLVGDEQILYNVIQEFYNECK